MASSLQGIEQFHGGRTQAVCVTTNRPILSGKAMVGYGNFNPDLKPGASL